MPGKDVYVVLAFHAHEPWWDLPAHILKTVDDEELSQTLPSDNWVRKRAEAGRDVYTHLLQLAKQLNAPMCLEATNELLMQIEEFAPATYLSLRDGYASGALYPIYGGAHHAHCTLLNVDELADELRLNQEFLHDVMGAPRPLVRGAFPMEGSIDARMQDAFVRAGVQYVIFPNLSPRKARYVIDGDAHVPYQPFRLSSGLLALPRHFGVSQDIWRPITKWKPEGLRLQGYILGMYPVFDHEYRDRKYVDFPISREQAIDEYRAVLESAVNEAPDGGLIVYIQDLELMDYGDEMLEIMGEAFASLDSPGVNVRIVSPDQYFEATGALERPQASLRFHQVSWAPEIRPVLRCDGHYPPLDAGPIDGYDFDLEVFRRWPFIFWEWGRFHVDVFNSLLQSFGYPLVAPLSAREWWERGYRYEGLTKIERLALHSRSMKQADNWGWQPDEDRQKRPYLHGHRIAELLLEDLKDTRVATYVSSAFAPLEERSLLGLGRLLELFIDRRGDYLRTGIERLGGRAGEHVAWAHKHLDRADERRSEAAEAIRRAQETNRQLSNKAPYLAEGVATLLQALRDHCRAVFLASDEIQRAWGSLADTVAMTVEMYRYLYDLYPPLFPQMLRELASPKEMALVDDPPLS